MVARAARLIKQHRDLFKGDVSRTGILGAALGWIAANRHVPRAGHFHDRRF